MFKNLDKNFIIHLIGLFVLTGLAIFFAILQAKYKIEITDVGMIIGGITGIVGIHGANAIKKVTNDDATK